MTRSLPSRFLVIVQARMNSSRFPGKVLYKIKDRPVLQHILDSVLCCCASDQIVVATSLHEFDDPIAEFCAANSFGCFRGSLENVAERFLRVIEIHQPDVFLRISGDSPLFDYRTVEEACGLWESGLDLLTTVGGYQQSGMHVEFVKSATFCAAYPKFSMPGHYEHVTKFFYENEEKFHIRRILSPLPLNEKMKFSLDTNDDLRIIKEVFDRMKRPHYTYTLREKAALLSETDSSSYKDRDLSGQG